MEETIKNNLIPNPDKDNTRNKNKRPIPFIHLEEKFSKRY
jgi:hypothetical protein